LALTLVGQVFIVHKTLLVDMLARFVERKYNPILIDFLSQRLASKAANDSLRNAAKSLLHNLHQDSNSSMIEFTGQVESLPSLAGLLLSYPAIYHSVDATTRLVDASINVVMVHTGGTDGKIVMQFSCPPDLMELGLEPLKSTVQEWKTRISTLQTSLKEKWINYTRAELCTLEIQIETRRVPILTL